MCNSTSSTGACHLKRLLLWLCLCLLCPLCHSVPSGTGKHTLEDALKPNITAADVAHMDVLAIIHQAVKEAADQGITLTEECEHRFGYSFVTDQRQYHYRMCKSIAFLKEDGTLGGAKLHKSTPLARWQEQTAQEVLEAQHREAAKQAKAAAGAGVTARKSQRHSRLLQDSLYSSPAESLPGALSRLIPTALKSLASKLLGLIGISRAQQLPAVGALHGHLSTEGRELLEEAAPAVDTAADASDAYSDELDTATKEAAYEYEYDDSYEDDDSGKPARSFFDANMDHDPLMSAVNSSWKSSVSCYLQPNIPRTKYHDTQTFCVARNIILDSCSFYDHQLPGFDVRWPAPKPGAVRMACRVNSRILRNRTMSKGYKNKVWWRDSTKDNAYDEVRHACDPANGQLVTHPVAFIMRDRYTHTLHELEIFATIFTSLAAADLAEVREKGIQIVIADQMPHASYRPTYAAISYPYRLRHLAEDPYPAGTCFKTAVFIQAFGNSLPFNTNPNTSDCYSPMMIAVHKWMRTLHRELDPSHLSRLHRHHAETGGIIRRNIVWTSRRNLEALRLTTGAGMTEWQSARMVPNENEVVIALQRAVMDWNSKSCLLRNYYQGEAGMADCRDSNVAYDLVFGEFSDVPYYPDQLMTIYRTGILIGVHGAALTFVTSTTAGESALLELAGVGWEATQTGNMLNLFPSLAHNMGAYYEQVRYPGPILDPQIATGALIRAMDEVAARIAARQAAETKAVNFQDQYNFDVMFPQSCPGAIQHKVKRYVENHPVKMNTSVGAMGLADKSGKTPAR